tara:strand:+ start:182 stop:508 length:327 start_codon:yes stop_codon:yes gene_type:complete
MDSDQKKMAIRIWENRVKEWQASGKNMKQWCRDKNIPASTFCKWKIKILGKNKNTNNDAVHKPSFIELHNDSDIGVEVSIKSISLKLSKIPDMDTVCRYLIALEQSSC